MNAAVVVVGSYVQDLIWRCAEFPRPGETTLGEFSSGPGGKGSNQAIAASRAGAATCFVGAVGADLLARDARAFYDREKTACRLVTKPRHRTGTAAILVNQEGENEIVVAPGANAALASRDVPLALLRSARVVVAQLESNLAATTQALCQGQRAGATTILNPAPMRADFDAALLRHVDVLIPNEAEFVTLLNRRVAGWTEARLRRLAPVRLHELCRGLDVPTVIVTLGARGCFLSGPDGFNALPGHTGLRVVDTTGAGDAFVGAFAAGLVRFDGNSLRAAIFANAAAALSVTKTGTAPAMPRAAAIARFLRERKIAL